MLSAEISVSGRSRDEICWSPNQNIDLAYLVHGGSEQGKGSPARVQHGLGNGPAMGTKLLLHLCSDKTAPSKGHHSVLLERPRRAPERRQTNAFSRSYSLRRTRCVPGRLNLILTLELLDLQNEIANIWKSNKAHSFTSSNHRFFFLVGILINLIE